jgi:hypothetical protein
MEQSYLFHFPFVAGVGAGHIVCQRFGASKFMVRGRGGTYVSLGGDLTAETGDGAGYYEAGRVKCEWVGVMG